jgi:CO/xanthine dehydrogenase FAD-binding subunit
MRRLKAFSYFEPATIEEAVRMLRKQGGQARPLAGGTDLLVRMKRGEILPSALINLKRIKGLDKIRKGPGRGISVGALTPISTIEQSPLIRSTHPMLAEAARLLGSPSIRNLATLGGNVGRASPASDMVPSLIVLNARVMIEGIRGKKEFDVERLFSGPGGPGTTTLLKGELIRSFFLPRLPLRSGGTYLKLGRHAGMDCALVGVAVCLSLSGKNREAKEARVALSAVAPVPLRATKTEEVLLSGPLTEERIREASRVAAMESSPIDDLRASGSYRKEMVSVLTYRAVLEALAHAERGDGKK